MTVTSEDGPPTIEAAARQLGVTVDAIDAAYGIVPIDPARGLYSVQVDSAKLPPETPSEGVYRGPFSNPRIEHFGPPLGSEAPKSDKKD